MICGARVCTHLSLHAVVCVVRCRVPAPLSCAIQAINMCGAVCCVCRSQPHRTQGYWVQMPATVPFPSISCHVRTQHLPVCGHSLSACQAADWASSTACLQGLDPGGEVVMPCVCCGGCHCLCTAVHTGTALNCCLHHMFAALHLPVASCTCTSPRQQLLWSPCRDPWGLPLPLFARSAWACQCYAPASALPCPNGPLPGWMDTGKQAPSAGCTPAGLHCVCTEKGKVVRVSVWQCSASCGWLWTADTGTLLCGTAISGGG